MEPVRPRVAIVGAGPAGAFAAERLHRVRGNVDIDLLERLPTPWGLLRNGVAPDHQEIKRLDETFHRETLGRGCRYFGNVEVGVDISHAELMQHYTAVIYATGAQTDKSLGIPGEDLPGSWPATEFVAWYNGHPDYRNLEFDLTPARAVVIGNGNVAADVIRVLTLSADALARTDVADHALEALRESSIEEVVVLGRRGPAQAAFTSSELRELGNLDGRGSAGRSRRGGTRSGLGAVAGRGGHVHRAEERRAVARVRGPAGRHGRQPPDRAAVPALAGGDPRGREGRGDRHPAATRSCARTTARSEPAPPTTRSRRSSAASCCAPSATRRCRCRTCRSTSAHTSCPTTAAACARPRVIPCPGVYTVGWIKRGPTGILGTNKRDAEETVRCLADDLDSGALPVGDLPGRDEIAALLAERNPDLVTAEGWRAIDAHELEQGSKQDRPRVKLASREELLEAAKS